jgi:hypothetical protein
MKARWFMYTMPCSKVFLKWKSLEKMMCCTSPSTFCV